MPTAYNNMNVVYASPINLSVKACFESESALYNLTLDPAEIIYEIRDSLKQDSFFNDPIFENAQDFYFQFMDMFKNHRDEIWSEGRYSYGMNYLKNHWRNYLYNNSGIKNDESFSPSDISGCREVIYKLNDYTSTYSVATIDNLCANMEPNRSLVNSVPLYPIAVKEQLGLNSYIIERAPFRIKLNFKTTKSHSREPKKRIDHYIWVPWSLYYFDSKTNRIVIYFGSGPSSDPDTRYINCTFPNTYADGSICWNSSLSGYDFSQVKDIREHFSTLINEYYSGGWNTDLFPHAIGSIRYREDLSDAYKNFIIPTKEYFPSYTPSKFEAFKDRAASYSYTNSYTKRFKHLFEVLSHYDLSQTLDFYKDLISTLHEGTSYHQSHSYETILSMHADSNSSDNEFQDAFTKITKYHDKNICQDVVIDRDILPNVYVNYENITFPLFETFFNSMIINDLNTSSDARQLREVHRKTKSIFIESSGHMNGFIQNVISQIIHNNISSKKEINSTIYLSYDFATKQATEYPDHEAYKEYLKNYNQSNKYEVQNATV